MPPPISTNGFKGPAPVLPAMGLHSFHNDSPPFAGAGMPDIVDPEPLSLDEHFSQTPTASRPSPTAAGFRPTSSLGLSSIRSSSPDSAPGPSSRPLHIHTNGTAKPTDHELSASRSRLLVSGYRFGNPLSPRSIERGSDNNDMAPMPNPALTGEPLGTPPIGESAGRDSPPLTEPNTNTSDSSSPSPEPSARGADEHDDDGEEHPDKDAVVIATAEESGLGARRRASKSTDRDSGIDALTGLNDGEADLDEAAPPADKRGTQGYLRGEEGDAGAYRFPRHRLRKTMKDESKIPLVIVACGSFSPPTYLHLRMFEMAKDEIVESQTYEIMAGYYSPVSSYYKKAGLAPAIHRVRMCELAVENTSTWLMVDPWEAGQPEYQRTAIVLDHFDEMLNGDNGGVTMADGSKRKYKIMLLAGGDLIESFGEPGVWSEPDLHIILGRFGCLIVERAGSDVWAFLLSHDILYHHRRNVIVIKQLIYNDISSTKVRLFVRRGMSIKYLLPNSVIQYIHEHRLYREADAKPIAK